MQKGPVQKSLEWQWPRAKALILENQSLAQLRMVIKQMGNMLGFVPIMRLLQSNSVQILSMYFRWEAPMCMHMQKDHMHVLNIL